MKSRHLLLVLMLAGVLRLPASLRAQEAVPDTGITIHVVQRGETLFRIALSYGTTVDELASLNGILDPGNIQVGQRLLVPGTIAATLPQIHTVQAGETLRIIADFYGLTLEQLATANNITDVNAIYVGQTLTIVPMLP